jgi:isopentenyl-diphosphate delta-isomerase
MYHYYKRGWIRHFQRSSQRVCKYRSFKFDTGGSGGTNFSLIEEKRQEYPEQILSTIGIPTPVSIIEVRKEIPESFIFATGGIRNSTQIVKSLVLGADIAAMAGFFLKTYNDYGEEKLFLEINRIIEEVKKIFVVLGFTKIEDAKNGKYILKNEIKEWIDQRV